MARLSHILAVFLVLVLLVTVSLAPATRAQSRVRVQLAFALDGSRSIHPTNFTVMTYGVARALGNTSVVPRDGSVEVCVVQFGLPTSAGDTVKVELRPIAITDQTMGYIQSTIRAMVQGQGDTPTAGGIRVSTQLLTGSANFAGAERQVINVATDGLPYEPAKFPGVPLQDVYALSAEDALVARDEAQAAGIDEIDAEVLGDLGQRPGQLQFFMDLVYPKPANVVPPDPMAPGFARIVTDFNDFEAAIYEKLAIILYPTPTPTLTSTPQPTATHTPPPTIPPTIPPTVAPSVTAQTPAASVTPFPQPSPSRTPTPGPTPTPEVPEPASLALLAGGLTALMGYAGWRRRSGRA
jgi:hypothetical protein